MQELFDVIVGTGTGKLNVPRSLKIGIANLSRRDYFPWCFQEGMVDPGCKRKVPYPHESGVLKTIITQTSLANPWRFCKRTNNAQLPLQK